MSAGARRIKGLQNRPSRGLEELNTGGERTEERGYRLEVEKEGEAGRR